MRSKKIFRLILETENDMELFSSLSWDENKKISFNRGEKIYLKDFERQYARYLGEHP